jgi:tetratricopeptide (TPR) repeat protein
MPGYILTGLKWSIAQIVVLAFGLIAVTAHAQDTLQISAATETRALLAEAETLLAGNDSEHAYALLIPHETELAGSPYYDYLLGVAALDSGRRSEAIFSLRRSIAVEPRFSGARMELGRAYFESGNPALARPIFVSLLGENPPAGVRDVLQQYIRAIDTPRPAPQSRFSGYFESFVGHDSNANGSTADQQFLGFMLSPENLATESPVIEIAAGFNWFVPKSSSFAWLVNARAGHRNNIDASFVNATILSGLGGMTWQRGEYFGRAAIDSYWASRDGNANESYAGLDLLFGRRLGDSWDVSLGLRGGAQRHDESIEVLDVNRVLYTFDVSQRFASGGKLSLQLIGGSDSEQQSGSPYGNSKTGGRISLSTPLGNASFLHASLGSLTSDYDGLFFGAPREDKQLMFLVQLEFRDVLTEGLSFVPLLRYVDNESDVSLYDYDRTEIGLLLRWVPR